MVNFNGNIYGGDALFLNHKNRGFRYGDALFESIRVVNSKLFFWEDHYLRLMASMRILRMGIPMNFTMEYLEEQTLRTVEANNLKEIPARIRITVFRDNGGLYLPESNDVSFTIEAMELSSPFYTLENKKYKVELFKDFYINPDMLSTLKTNNRILNVVGSIFAKENGYQNCLLINNLKQVVEALNGNLFLVKDNIVKTPPLSTGCLNGIIRKKLIGILEKLENYTFVEEAISPFELQKSDELFITNSIIGIQPISKYRKKIFRTAVALDLIGKLNTIARLG